MVKVNRVFWKIVIDFGILCILGAPLLIIMVWGNPHRRGYFENDMTIRLPVKEDTVSVSFMAGLGFAVNVVTILIVELVRDKFGRPPETERISPIRVSGFVWESYTFIGIFTFGAACQQLTSELAKGVIGRLRPNFYAICQPIPSNSSLNALGYIQDYTCVETDAFLLKDIYLSFPSAHASFAMYCGLFFTFYIQLKVKWRGSKLLRHFLQFLAMAGAWLAGLTRVLDHKHHWDDVAVGFLIGTVYAIGVFMFLVKPAKYQRRIYQEPGQTPPQV